MPPVFCLRRKYSRGVADPFDRPFAEDDEIVGVVLFRESGRAASQAIARYSLRAAARVARRFLR